MSAEEEKAHEQVLRYFMNHFDTIPIQGPGFYKIHTKSIDHTQTKALARLNIKDSFIKRSGTGVTIIINT